METRFLTAEELLQRRKATDKSMVFQNSQGAKSFSPSGSWLEQKQLDCVLRGVRDVIVEEKVAKFGELCQGEWKPDINQAVVYKEKGKSIQYLGERVGNLKHLSPQEALFLLETGTIEILYCNAPVSVQQGYALFLSSKEELESYYTYAHLSRLGFIVIKHQGSLKTNNQETETKLDPNCLKKKIETKIKEGPEPKKSKLNPSESEACAAATLLETNKSTSPLPNDHEIDSKIDQIIHSILPVTLNDETNVPQEKNIMSKPSTKIDFPNFAGRKSLKLKAPATCLIPSNVVPQKQSYELKLLTNRRYGEDKNWSSKPDYPSAVPKLKCTELKNWEDFKKKMLQEKNNPESSQGFVLWSGKTKPLIKMNELLSTVEVQTRLDIVGKLPFNSEFTNFENSQEAFASIEINYDVYLPGTIFRKSRPSSPNLRVSVTNVNRPVPRFEQIARINHELKDQVPIYFAVVSENGDVAFYGFSETSVPRYEPLKDLRSQNK